MVPKALLFLLAFVLLVSTQVTSTEEETSTDHEKHHYHHAKAPAHAPEHSPKKDWEHHHNHECVKKCIGREGYCKSKNHSEKECGIDCIHCCHRYKCVPGANKKCTWDKVLRNKKWVKCP